MANATDIVSSSRDDLELWQPACVEPSPDKAWNIDHVDWNSLSRLGSFATLMEYVQEFRYLLSAH